MTFDLYLIAEPASDAVETAAQLTSALEAVPAAVLLVRADQGESDADYLARVERLLPIAQGSDCAVLLDNRPDLVRRSRSDGVHMSGGVKALREALDALKPDFIVGTGDIGTRHEAMVRGELDVDYLMFGDRDDVDGPEMAQWWAETFEVPAVLCTTVPGGSKAEFVAVAQKDWGVLGTVMSGAGAL